MAAIVPFPSRALRLKNPDAICDLIDRMAADENGGAQLLNAAYVALSLARDDLGKHEGEPDLQATFDRAMFAFLALGRMLGVIDSP